jgi:hypothetical protein
MKITFGKILGQIAIEVLKSATLVIVSSLISQSLRKATTGAAESAAQLARFTHNKFYEHQHKEKAA